MFYDANDHAFLRYLEAQHGTVLEEFRRVPLDDYVVWEQVEAYQGTWRVFPLWSIDPDWDFADVAPRNAARCPRTVAMVRRIPGLQLVAFSLLEPGTHIYRHADFTMQPTVRCHLGLRIPDGGGLRIDGDVRGWSEGRCLGFDSGTPHEAANTSTSDRVVLLVDVARSEADRPIHGWTDGDGWTDRE